MVRSSHPTIVLIDPVNWYPRLTRGIDPPYATWQSGYICCFDARDKIVPIDVNIDAPPPSLAEADIVFIDMGLIPFHHEPSVRQNTATNGPWATMSAGRIDTRVIGLSIIKEALARSIKSGAVCVIFVSNQGNSYLRLGRRGEQGEFTSKGDISDVWDMIPVVEMVDSERDMGTSLNPLPAAGTMSEWFIGTFDTVLRPGRIEAANWQPLAVSKHGDTVAARVEHGRGQVYLLPNLGSKPEFAAWMIRDYLPTERPDLFPSNAIAPWRHHPDYELVEVLRLKGEAERIREEANSRLAAANASIEEARAKDGFLQHLLLAHDDELEEAIARALLRMGCDRVIHCSRDEPNALKREDLRVEMADGRFILVEAKGIGGTGTESDQLQVTKHLFPRSKELQTHSISGLHVQNHQRHIEPLKREQHPFSPTVIANAELQHVGLLTTWNLFRLLRNAQRLKWIPNTDLLPLLFKHGPIDAVPMHYEAIGVVEKTYPKVGVVIVALHRDLNTVPRRLAFEGPVDFDEDSINSMRLDDVDVVSATSGQVVGFKTKNGSDRLRPGMKVYRILRD